MVPIQAAFLSRLQAEWSLLSGFALQLTVPPEGLWVWVEDGTQAVAIQHLDDVLRQRRPAYDRVAPCCSRDAGSRELSGHAPRSPLGALRSCVRLQQQPWQGVCGGEQLRLFPCRA